MTSKEISQLNKMNRAAQNATLGTRLNTLEGVVTGSLVVSSAQATASAIVIQTIINPIVGKIVQASRSGSAIPNVKCTTSGSNLNITSASPAWVIAADDALNYIVW